MHAAVAILALALISCGSEDVPAAGRLPLADSCEQRPDGWRCEEGQALRCEDGRTQEQIECEAEQVCVAGAGCRRCQPHTVTCEDERFMRCRFDGSGYDVERTCSPDTQCSVRGCRDLCADAAEERSYIGCEYWPVTTANAALAEGFEPALVIGNPNFQVAKVRLSRGEQIETLKVPPGEAGVLPLPFVSALKEPYHVEGGDEDPQLPHSVLARGGGYRLTSNVPVTVHQFNPLEFQDETCASEEGGRNLECFSFTNDASLLLPTTVLTGDYMVLTRPTMVTMGASEEQKSAFVAIAGTQGEPTEVEIRVTAHVAASNRGDDDAFEALAPGDTLRVTLGAGDVLQLASDRVPETCPGATREHESRSEDDPHAGLIHCDAGEDYDLTGTEIEASAPVSVIAGHDCAFVPYDRFACDHLEEAMFPVQSWGDQVLVTAPRRADGDRHRLKVVSAVDGNRLRVQPPLDAPVTLDRGQSYEWFSDTHVSVRADGPISVAQFLLGQGGGAVRGDPAMSLAIPHAQFKRDYALLTPETFPEAYVNIVAVSGVRVFLDGERVETFSPVGDAGWSVARVRLHSPGLHVVEGKAPVGVVLYGFAQYTSYMVPGGLDFRLLQGEIF